jgi:hypothetical protein
MPAKLTNSEKARLLDLALTNKNVCATICWEFGDGWSPEEDHAPQAIDALQRNPAKELLSEENHA